MLRLAPPSHLARVSGFELSALILRLAHDLDIDTLPDSSGALKLRLAMDARLTPLMS